MIIQLLFAEKLSDDNNNNVKITKHVALNRLAIQHYKIILEILKFTKTDYII